MIAYTPREKREHRHKYYVYLQSPKWKYTRSRVLRRDGYLCQRCRNNSAEIVHHKTYDRVFNEAQADLVSLCRNCHKKEHKK